MSIGCAFLHENPVLLEKFLHTHSLKFSPIVDVPLFNRGIELVTDHGNKIAHSLFGVGLLLEAYCPAIGERFVKEAHEVTVLVIRHRRELFEVRMDFLKRLRRAMLRRWKRASVHLPFSASFARTRVGRKLKVLGKALGAVARVT